MSHPLPTISTLILAANIAAPAGATPRIFATPPALRGDRWTCVTLHMDNPGPEPLQAKVVVTRASGRRETWAKSLGPYSSTVRREYLFEGHPDPVTSVEGWVGTERVSWEPPRGIPPEQELIVVTGDPAVVRRVASRISTQGVGVHRLEQEALPDRWLALRGAAGVVLGRDVRLLGPQQEALLDYAAHGGAVWLLPGAPWGGLIGEVGRGLVARWDPTTQGLPRIARWPRPPMDAPALGLPRGDRWPPIGRLGMFFGLWALASVLAASTRRAWALPGLAVAGMVAMAPPAPVAERSEAAVWTGPPTSPIRVRWEEVRFVPLVTGRVRLQGVPDGNDVAVVPLDQRARLALELDEDSGTWWVDGRWGEPVDLLVESDAPDS